MKRIKKVIRSFFGFETSETSPETVLEAGRQKLAGEMARYNQSLAASISLCEVLKGQIRKLAAKEEAFQSALDQHLRSGTDEEAAGEAALRLENVRRELAGLRPQLEEAEATCKQISAAREAALETARKRLDDLKGTLDAAQIHQALSEIERFGRAKTK